MWKQGKPIELAPLPTGLGGYQGVVDARPLLLRHSWVEGLMHIQALLLRAMQGLLTDPATADFLDLSGPERDQLQWASQRPLRLGTLRPDFVVDVHGQPKICEINARFPVNGFLVTAYLADQFAAAGYRPTCAGDEIRRALSLPPGSMIVKGREPGWDIHQLALDQSAAMRQTVTAAACVVLELHQDELLALQTLPAGDYWNDLRTQWLGHDKRLLGLLARAEVVERWLGSQAQELSQAVIPTCTVRDFVGHDGVLKPNRSGKGKGMVFARDLSGPDWRRQLAESPPHWVVQPYVEGPCLGSDQLVGTLLSRDQERLGLGIFRAAPQRLVNVSAGGRVIFPVICDD